MPTLRDILDQRVREADPSLVENLGNNRVRCFSCGHCCPIPEGQPGVCKVRFNSGGNLRPRGYTAGMQCDLSKRNHSSMPISAQKASFGMPVATLHGYCQGG